MPVVSEMAMLPAVFAFLCTYLLHSTLLLGSTWFILRFCSVTSPVLEEYLWKGAATIGLLTALLQHSVLSVRPVVNVSLPQWERADSAGLSEPTQAVRSQSVPWKDPSGSLDVLASRQDADSEEGDAEADGTRSVPATLEGSALSQPSVPAPNAPRIPVSRTDVAASTFPGDLNGSASSENSGWLSIPRVESIIGLLLSSSLVGGSLRLAFQTVAFHRGLRRNRSLASDSTLKILEDIKAFAGVRKPVLLLLSGRYDEPVAFGILRWHIVLPTGIESRVPEDELKAMLAHELAHLVRGDGLWLWWGRFLCMCLAWQPLNFVARRRWQAAAELQCDDWAIHHVGDRFALARCLTRILEFKQHRPCVVPALSVAGARFNVSKRVERLVAGQTQTDSWNTPARGRMLAVAAIGVVLALACWGPKTELAADVRDGVSSIETFGDNEQVPSQQDEDDPMWAQDNAPFCASLPASPEGSEDISPQVAEELQKTHDELALLNREVQELIHALDRAPAKDEAAVELRHRLAIRIGELTSRWHRMKEQVDRQSMSLK